MISCGSSITGETAAGLVIDLDIYKLYRFQISGPICGRKSEGYSKLLYGKWQLQAERVSFINEITVNNFM